MENKKIAFIIGLVLIVLLIIFLVFSNKKNKTDKIVNNTAVINNSNNMDIDFDSEEIL